jgi:hypothetical protein
MKSDRPTYTITLRAEPCVNGVRALRGVLKVALRQFGLRAISIIIEESKANQQTTKRKDNQMDMRKFAGTAFIKVCDVRDGSLQRTIAEIREGRFGPEAVFGDDAITLNQTSVKAMIRAYGPDSKHWHGKRVELVLGKIPFNGVPTDSVIVNPLTPALPPDERAADDEIPF